MKTLFKRLVRLTLGKDGTDRLTIAYWRFRNRREWSYETELKFLSRWVRPGDLVVDVGANMGQYSLALSRLVKPGGRVVAFEASASTAALTSRILEGTGVELHVCALSDRVGTAELELFADLAGNLIRGHTRLAGTGEARQVARTETTRMARLEDVVKDRKAPIRFIKIDVEGHETAVLSGAGEILSHDRPMLLIEANSRDHFLELKAVLERRRYRPYVCAPDGNLQAVEDYHDARNNYFFRPEPVT